MVSDGTKIWIATESPSGGGQGSAGILQGAFNSSGGIDWEEGWSLPFFTTIQDMLLEGTNIYVSTSGSGLFTLNTTTGSLLRESGSIHNSLGDLDMHVSNGVSTMYVGLLGTFATSAGVQAFNIAAGHLKWSTFRPTVDNIQGFAFSFTCT